MQQKDRIAQLKTRKKLLEEEIKTLMESLIPQPVDSGSETEKKEGEDPLKELKDKLAVKKADITAINEEIALRRMNKNDSAFFEWIPNKGMNRQQARRFRKYARQHRLG